MTTATARWTTAIVAFAAVALIGCASAQSGMTGDDMTLQVINDRIPGGAITVYAVPETGTRRVLGNVSANDTATFTFSTTASQYRLLARTTGGAELVSPPFSALPPETVRWSLRSNIVVPIDREG